PGDADADDLQGRQEGRRAGRGAHAEEAAAGLDHRLDLSPCERRSLARGLGKAAGAFGVLSPARRRPAGYGTSQARRLPSAQATGRCAMVETTILVVAGKGLRVPRVLKRVLQIAIAVGLTALVLLVVIVGNGLLVGRQVSLQAGVNVWLAFIKRPDILST